MASLNVNLSDELQQFVLVQTQVGQFSEPGDYIESLVARAKENKESLEALLIEGFESGDPISLDAVEWKKIRSEVAQRIQQ